MGRSAPVWFSRTLKYNPGSLSGVSLIDFWTRFNRVLKYYWQLLKVLALFRVLLQWVAVADETPGQLFLIIFSTGSDNTYFYILLCCVAWSPNLGFHKIKKSIPHNWGVKFVYRCDLQHIKKGCPHNWWYPFNYFINGSCSRYGLGCCSFRSRLYAIALFILIYLSK